MEIDAFVREVSFTKNYDKQSYRVRIDAEFYVDKNDLRCSDDVTINMQVFDSVGSGMDIKLVIPTMFPNIKEESYTFGSTKGKVRLEWPDYNELERKLKNELERKLKKVSRMLRLE